MACGWADCGRRAGIAAFAAGERREAGAVYSSLLIVSRDLVRFTLTPDSSNLLITVHALLAPLNDNDDSALDFYFGKSKVHIHGS
jgi:hypothetical protein